MMKENVLLRFLAVLLLAAMLAGCTSGNAEETAPGQEQMQARETNSAEILATDTATEVAGEVPATGEAADENQDGKETQPAETQAPPVPQPTVPQNCIVVSTAFGNLQYQDQWIEFMRVEQHAEGDNLRVAFSAEINNVRYGLFDLLIGDMDGTPVGKLTDAEGVQRNVYIHMMEIVETSALTESEQNRLFAMQEDINYIIENLK